LPPPLPPPQDDIPALAKSTNSPRIAHLARRLNPTKNNANASAVPPGETQNKIFVRFSALVAAVVITVSVEVLAAVPLRETETGFKLQVGMLLTTVNAVVTLHVRFTVPLNPFVPTTLTVPVFPEVEPRVTVMDVVAPGPVVKPGVGRLIV
jgi:hypothetical protein